MSVGGGGGMWREMRCSNREGDGGERGGGGVGGEAANISWASRKKFVDAAAEVETCLIFRQNEEEEERPPRNEGRVPA